MAVILSSCRAEREYEDFPEERFRQELSRSWYVAHYDSKGFLPKVIYAFDGDSVIEGGYNNFICTIDDPELCTLQGIENIQFWHISESNNVLYLETQDLCGGVNNFTITYENYGSAEQLYFPGRFSLQADISLIGHDTLVVLNNFQFMVTDGNPASSEIYFHALDWDRYFIILPAD